VSTDDQCLSVAGQFAAIKIAAETHGWEIVAQFTDEGVRPSDSTHDPKKESATQLSLIKQIRNELPQLSIEQDKTKSKPSYTASLSGKMILQIDQSTLLITRTRTNH
jgi:hypothetical protein